MKIVNNDKQHPIVETDSGVRLTLCAVRRYALQSLMVQAGITKMAHREREGGDLEQEARKLAANVQEMEAAMQLFNYCMAYGIQEQPPTEALEELRLLGPLPETVPARRAAWMNYIVIQDGQEAGLIAGAIMALTFQNKVKAKAE